MRAAAICTRPLYSTRRLGWYYHANGKLPWFFERRGTGNEAGNHAAQQEFGRIVEVSRLNYGPVLML